MDMKKTIFSAFLTVALLGCQEGMPDEITVSSGTDFVGMVETVGDVTKTEMGTKTDIYWSQGDQIAIFQACTLADKYQVTNDSAGKSNGTFRMVSDHSGTINGDFTSGNEISSNIAVYPYSDKLSCSRSKLAATGINAYEIGDFVLPAVQYYAYDTFGNGTFPMIAVTENMSDHALRFKNVCGAIKLQLRGTDIVKSVKVEGKNKEILSGPATITAYPGDRSPEITMTGINDVSRSVVLDCGNGIQLNETTSKNFIIVLPPVVFSKGFVVTLTTAKGIVRTIQTDKANVVLRSTVLVMPDTDGTPVLPEDDYPQISRGPITLSLSDVTGTTALFEGKLDVDAMANYQEAGYVYSTDEILDVESKTSTKVKISRETYSQRIDGLSYDTEYYYTVYMMKNGIYQYGETQKFKTDDITISVDDVKVTNTTATFVGIVTRDDADASVKVGIQYSAASSFESTSSLEVVPDEDGAYSVVCDGLYHAKEYYYRTYVYQDGVYEYSDVMTFTTNAVSVELKVESNTQTTVQFGGKIDPSTAIDEVQIAVLINTSETVTRSDYSKKYTLTSEDIKEDGSFDVSMSGLKFGTTYYYTYYVLNNSAYSYGTIQNFKTEDVPVNLSVGEITQTAATISGNVSLTEKNVLEVGLLYSSFSSDPKVTTSGVNKVVLTDIIDADGNFTYKAENLLNEKPYYYRCYIMQGSSYTYGDVSTFQTEKVPVTIEVESIDKNVVTFKGNVQFSEAGVIEIGVQYYPKSTTSQTVGVLTKTITEISENGDFTVEISGLLLGKEYCWQYYLLQNGVKVVGPPQTFETIHPYEVPSDLNMSSALDLSSSATANCYIISNPGLYKFRTVKGNSLTSVGSAVSAKILWETFGGSTAPECLDLIKGVSYKDDYIVFQTAYTFKEGNAVIAAKDASGKILWSWHIWLTDIPQGQVYYNNAGIMMDRNLGATSATPGDVGALGLLYQWGRKDPFLGSSSIIRNVVAKSTIVWPSPVSSSSSLGTIAYAVEHPTTFITHNSSNSDWYYTGSSDTDDTRWQSKKTIYDPCPAGWRVPDGGSNGVWSEAVGSSSDFDYSYDSTERGMNFTGRFGSASTIWYPASGYRFDYDGSLNYIGNRGRYWSASPSGHDAYFLYFSYDGYVDPWFGSSRAYGCSVRCLQE